MSVRSMLKTGKANATYVNIKSSSSGAEDALGGYTGPSRAVIYTNVLCRFNALTTKEVAIFSDKQDVKANYYVYMEYMSGIKETDRLVKIDDGREFDVKLILDWDEDRNYMKLAVLEVARLE